MAGSHPHNEEAIRALFATNAMRLGALAEYSPADVCYHARCFAAVAFPQPALVAGAG